MDNYVSRRRVLAGSATLLGVGLAGCTDDEDGEDNGTDDDGGGVGGGY
jgi:hypothetical protein